MVNVNIQIAFCGIFVDGNALLYSSLGYKKKLQLALTNASVPLEFGHLIICSNKMKGLRPFSFFFLIKQIIPV